MPGYLTFFAHFLKKIVYGQWLMGNYFVSLNPNYDHIRMKQLIIILAVLLVQTAQAQVAEVTPTQADGIRRIKVEAVTDKIIRVRATAENQFPQKQSLIVVPQEGKKIHSSIATEGNTITLTTKELRTAIDRTTGRISFYDKNGNLTEQNEVLQSIGTNKVSNRIQPLYNVDGEIANYFVSQCIKDIDLT
jgi:hypothetical protein